MYMAMELYSATESIKTRIAECSNKVLVYKKEGCPLCTKVNDVLRSIGVQPVLEDIESMGTELRNALAAISGGDTSLPR